MGSFVAVTSGNPTLASDINQYASILNGSTPGGVVVNGGNNANTPYIAQESALPGVLQELFAGMLTGDALKRLALHLRSDGYGGFYAGTGASTTAHLYATAAGWRVTESLTVDGALSVAGASSLAGLSLSGTFSSDAGKITSDGNGKLAAQGGPYVISDGTTTRKIWTGLVDPGGSAAEGDLWAKG